MMKVSSSTMSALRRPSHFIAASLLAGTAIIVSGGCSATDDITSAPGENVDQHGLTFEEFEASVYQEPDSGIYIVDGDTPIRSRRELKEFYINYVQSGALIVHTVGGVDAKWTDAQKVNITYCVNTSFGNNHAKVVQAMADATSAWEGAANVDFKYVSAQNSSCTASNNNVVFDVRPVNSGGQYLARAFFPDSPRSARNVLIDNSAFSGTGSWSLAGILRHELGHTLGFRHEHTRPNSGTCFEDNNWRPLTSYDPYSVMHYPQCNGSQTGDLVLTQKDKEGVAALYGAPGQPPPPPPPPSGCAHPICESGTKLTSGCDPCVTKICAQDSFCCSNSWDAQCVGEVKTICGVTCQAPPPPPPPPPSSCAHPICKTGVKLDPACDPCAKNICAADPFCCNDNWDAQCVAEVKSICGVTCQ